MLAEPLQVVKRIVEALDRLRLPYLIGGSVASSLHGIYRFTNDVDFVIDLHETDVTALVEALQNAFYIDDEMIRDAIRMQSSFSILHLESMVKADMFLREPDPWMREEWVRRQTRQIGVGEDAYTISIASPEDMILQKLRRYRLGGGISDRQWGDITGMLKVQQESLDYAYLRQWGAELALSDLLQRAYDDAGIVDR